jgi:autotransporter-associated beta strand protein
MPLGERHPPKLIAVFPRLSVTQVFQNDNALSLAKRHLLGHSSLIPMPLNFRTSPRHTKRLFVLSTTILIGGAVQHAGAQTLYWDGPGPADWGVAANWSTVDGATEPDPAAPPDADDIAAFKAGQTVNLNGPQAALGLTMTGAGNVLVQGGGTNSTLSLGASGIVADVGTKTINIGSTTPGQNVNVSLQADQSWLFNGANALSSDGIQIRNNVSLGIAGAHTLTLGGNSGNTSISPIQGAISDGLGILSITMAGPNANNRWNLNSNSNTYSGLTTITAGALGAGAVNALGATSAGTTVASGAALFLRAGVTYAAEPLTIAGIGPAGSARGALRLVPSVTANWTGPIIANATAGPVRIGADMGTLTITAASSITTQGTNALQFETNVGTIVVNANISGSAGVTKLNGPANGFLTLSGLNNTYTGATVVNAGVFTVTGALVNTSAVTVALGTTLRGTGTINPAALTTISGTLEAGNATSPIGTFSMGSLTMNAGSTFSLQLDSSLETIDLVNVAGNLTLDLGDATVLTVSDLAAISTPLSFGTTLTFLDYTGTWNGGLFTFGGNVIEDDTSTFVVGANTFTINYNGGVGGTDVQLTAVPEPGAWISLLSGLGLLAGLQRLRRRR